MTGFGFLHGFPTFKERNSDFERDVWSSEIWDLGLRSEHAGTRIAVCMLRLLRISLQDKQDDPMSTVRGEEKAPASITQLLVIVAIIGIIALLLD